MFNKIAIIGVGLIGGSIGLAARQKKIAKEVVGVCRHKESLRRAIQIGAIDQGTLNYKDAVKDADLVILAMPVTQIIKIGRKLVPYLKKGCLVTDAGSTKEEIVREIEKALPGETYFVGAHPLAGSEKRGVAFARADLFVSSLCILTKTAKTKQRALGKTAAFWQRLGCRTEVVSPHRHDQIVALVSHLPHLAATQLVKVAKNNLDFAASGFFDTTRIASSDAEVWTDIFLTNKKFVVRALGKYIEQLRLSRDLIRKGNRKRLEAEFRKARRLRNALQK